MLTSTAMLLLSMCIIVAPLVLFCFITNIMLIIPNMNVTISALASNPFAVRWNSVKIADTRVIIVNDPRFIVSMFILFPVVLCMNTANPSSSLPKKKFVSIRGTMNPQDISVSSCESASIGTVLDSIDKSDCVEKPVINNAVIPRNITNDTSASTIIVVWLELLFVKGYDIQSSFWNHM